MINDLKMGFKVLKYGLSLKTSVIAAILFVVMGFVFGFMSPSLMMSGFYVGFGAMLMVQLVNSISVASLIKGSPHKKALQTSVPAIVSGSYLLVANTILLLVEWIGCMYFGHDITEISNGILYSTIMMIIIMLYMAGAMKAFWPATVIFFIVYLSFYFYSMIEIYDEVVISPMIMPVWMAVIASYVIIIVAALFMYGLSMMMYKKEYSKINFETALKRASK